MAVACLQIAGLFRVYPSEGRFCVLVGVVMVLQVPSNPNGSRYSGPKGPKDPNMEYVGFLY